MQLKLVTDLNAGDRLQWGLGFATVEAVEVFMFDQIRVMTDQGSPIYPCNAKVWVWDADPDQTIVNRRDGYRKFPPPDLCEMCGGSLTGGIRPCVCRVHK